MTGLATENTLIRNTSDVEDFARRCFLGSTGDQVGVELEFLVFDRTAPARQVPMARIADALPPLPGGSRVTFEPGGQLELSGTEPARCRTRSPASPPTWTPPAGRSRDAGLALGGVGLDPLRPARRQLRLPRYEAMAAFLGAPYGSLMMCSTASIQVNLDLGERPAARWERAHLLGPVLVAAFANSPLSEGRPCGWMSGRQAVWERLDPTRTAARARGRAIRRGLGGLPARRPAHAGATRTRPELPPVRRRLDLPRPAGRARPARRPPTDLAYHATTLFPPVRPRGWLEIRYLDAQHPANWPVCVAVTHALVIDDRAADAAMAAAEPYAGDVVAGGALRSGRPGGCGRPPTPASAPPSRRCPAWARARTWSARWPRSPTAT